MAKLNAVAYAVENVEGADDLKHKLSECDDENPLEVHSFEMEIDLSELNKYIKRFDIVVKTRALGGTPLSVVERHLNES